MARTLILILLFPLSSPAQQREERIVIGTNVACREQPTRSAKVLGTLDLPGLVWVEEEQPSGAEGGSWLRVRSFSPEVVCWVAEALTTPYERERPEEVLLTIADHFVASSEGRPLEDFVRVDNLFAQEWAGYGHHEIDFESSPILSLRRLELLSAAMRATSRREVLPDPFKHAWILSHGRTLRSFEPSGTWVVDHDAFWALHDRFENTSMADELAWAAARQPVYHDCEDSGDCYLGRITRSLSRYWQSYPNGRFIEEALGMAVEYAEITARCREEDWPVFSTREGIESVRRTLSGVPEAKKAKLLGVLSRAEADCLVRTQSGPKRPTNMRVLLTLRVSRVFPSSSRAFSRILLGSSTAARHVEKLDGRLAVLGLG